MVENSVSPDNAGLVDVDLFSGAGGLSLGLSYAGIRPDYLIEVDPTCVETLKANKKAGRIDGEILGLDVSTISWRGIIDSPVRLLAAGPPCQPFSTGGHCAGEKDVRNMFPPTMCAIRELHPQAILIENVSGLLRKQTRRYLDYVMVQIEFPQVAVKPRETWEDHFNRIEAYRRSGGVPAYRVKRKLLNAADFGVPQIRWRIFVLALRADIVGEIIFPRPTHSRAAFVAALERSHGATKAEAFRRGKISWLGYQNEYLHPSLSADVAAKLKPWTTIRSVLDNLPPPARKDDGELRHFHIPGARIYPCHTGSPVDEPAKTIKAGTNGFGGGENVLVHRNRKHRYFTLREMAQLQGFPDDYVFCGSRTRAIKQIGNAVPIPLARAVGREIRGSLAQLA